MTIFARLFSAGVKSAYAPTDGRSLTTTFERQRLARSMPGEMGARTGSRFGLFL